jgi:Bacterial PH domain
VTYRFGPHRGLSALALVLAVVAAGVAATSTDPAGRLLAAGAAIVLAVHGALDLVLWPRLTVSAAGLRVRAPARRALFRWPEVSDVRLDERRRFGLTAGTLEIDAGDELVVLSRWALGADPREVLAVVRGFAPPRSGTSDR